jgi:hypothetical protein
MTGQKMLSELPTESTKDFQVRVINPASQHH